MYTALPQGGPRSFSPPHIYIPTYILELLLSSTGWVGKQATERSAGPLSRHRSAARELPLVLFRRVYYCSTYYKAVREGGEDMCYERLRAEASVN